MGYEKRTFFRCEKEMEAMNILIAASFANESPVLADSGMNCRNCMATVNDKNISER